MVVNNSSELVLSKMNGVWSAAELEHNFKIRRKESDKSQKQIDYYV